MSVDDLAERLSRLEDGELARELVYDYAHVLDEPSPETVAALFAPDATLTTPGGTVRGTDEITAFFARAFAAARSAKRHFVANPRVTRVAPARIRVRSAYLYTDREVLGWGTYDDLIDVSGPLFRAKTITPGSTLTLP